MTKITAMLIALAPMTMLGQRVTIIDNSLPGSRISVYGTVTFDPRPEAVTCAVTGKNNNSTQSIMFFAVGFSETAPTGQTARFTWTHDHYWAPATEMIAGPMGKFDVNGSSFDCAMTPQPGQNALQPTTPKASAEVLFVQFDDGTFWTNGKEGSLVATARINKGRVEEVNFMNSLHNAYITSGLTGLKTALAVKQSGYHGTVVRQQYLQQMAGSSAGMQGVADEVEKKIAIIKPRSGFLTVNVNVQ